MASTIRTFIAVPIPAGVQRAIGRFARLLARAYPEYRWSAPEKMHLTLNFLGDIPDRIVGDLCAKVAQVAASHVPFECVLGRIGAFPKPARPRVLWLGLDQGGESLSRLHYDLNNALRELDIEPERKRYHPHLTLARLRDGVRWPISLANDLQSGTLPTLVTSVQFDAEEMVVYSSFLDASGSEHTPMSRAVLGRP